MLVELYSRLRQHIQEPRLRWTVLNSLGSNLRYAGQIEEAMDCGEKALELARQEQGLGRVSASLGNLAICYEDTGQLRRTLPCHEEALEIATRAGDRTGVAYELHNLGCCYGRVGEYDEALTCLERSLALAQQLGDRRLEAAATPNLALVLIDQQRYADAIAQATAGMQFAQRAGITRAYVKACRSMAVAQLLLDNLAEARSAADAAVPYDELECNHECRAILGIAALRQHDRATAQQAFREAIVFAERALRHNPHGYLAADAKGLAIAGLALADGTKDLQPALDAHRQARAITREAGVVARVLRLYHALRPADLLAPVRIAAGEK